MFKSISYVIKENFSNVYRIFCIAKYELLSDMRDSKFGIFWNFASPAIQVFTYWLVFGIAWGRKAQTYRGITVEYLPWLVVAFSVWWYIRPCIVDGCSAVFSKTNVITRMKFPVSVLPATVCLKELFNHFVMLIITFVTFVLIADFQMKSIGAMLGTIFGVIVSGLIALLFGHFGHVTGFNVDDIENLIYVGQNSRLDIGGMLFSGILIASLGAVMDVAMSVSTSLHEIKEQRPDITAKEIFKSGINIGRDMIGTMSNTLILAYAGGSLGLVMIIYAYSYQMHQILNMYSLAIEIMRGIAGTIGIILTVPITSLIMSVLLTRGGQKISTDKCK